MRLARAHLLQFKRFTDLTVQGIGEDVRLVVLAGPNGSGKSSLFDAFLLWGRMRYGGYNDDTSYYWKGPAETANTMARINLQFYGPEPTGEDAARAFYVRTAYRNDPEFRINSLQRQGPLIGERRFGRMIDGDATVTTNYQRLASQSFEDAFALDPSSMTLGQFREKVIGQIRDSMLRVFPDLILNTLGNPLEDGTFRFKKGGTQSFDYKNLSGGEKATFDLLLDIIVKRRELARATYLIDEPDTHMNARLQGALLQELVDLLPQTAQLWVATHSIGMMRKARELYEENPKAVAFIDFGGHDFDRPTVIEPEPPTRLFWQRQLSVAMDDLAHLVAPREIVICEGSPASPVAGKNAEFDAICYDTIFADQYPDVKFLSAGSSSEVANDRLAFVAMLPKIASGIIVRRLIDRDDHAPSDVADFNSRGIRVLGRRNIECYLYDDEILTALCVREGMEDHTAAVLAAAEKAVEASVGRGNPPNDLKSAAGDIFTSTRQILKLVGAGNDPRAFARSTLAPLVKPGTDTYERLRHAIFGT
jgi:predicted ATPase